MRLINEALSKNTEEMYHKHASRDDFGNASIIVVGCGGAGNNTVHRLVEIGIEGAETIVMAYAVNYFSITDVSDIEEVVFLTFPSL